MSFSLRVRWALVASVLLFAAPLAAETLPRPAGLEPEIGFWRRIFAEVTTEQALIHDNRYLGVVYEKVDLSPNSDAARVRRVAEVTRDKYERILRTLASGKREGLSTEEARVLALWPADVTNRELADAVERVRFQQGLADRFHAGLARSGQWLNHIQKSLHAAGVPEELAALPHVESSFDPRARSFVGAAGLWQFTSDTGRRFMRIDQVVDERRDPYESSEAAARLLKYNYSILGTWPLAITAYNHGVAGMRRAVQRSGTENIETIIRRYDGPAFGFASRNFYVSFLAALEIEKNPEKFFGAVQRQSPRPELIVEVPDYMRVDTLERAFGVSRDTLQSYNPALLPPVWEGAKYVPRGFRLRLPANGVIEAAPQQTLAAIPGSQRYSAQVPDKTHRVQRGDTLSGIARRYGTNVPKLATANSLSPKSRIRVGQVLRLPAPAGFVGAPPSPLETAPAPVSAAVAATEPKSDSAEKPETYRVQPGDSVAGIAQRTGISQKNLLAYNDIANANLIRIGQNLRLTPDSGNPVTTIPAAAAAAIETLVVVADGDASLPTGDAAGTAALLADPSDYLVADNDTVEVQASETLSHYAGWLELSPDDLRKANGWSRQRSLVMGQRVRLVFTKTDRDTFLNRRVAYHHDLQEEFFSRYRIADTMEHRLRRGESVWVLALQKYKVPVWLLRQYNPTLDLDQLRPGTRVVFPRLERVAAEGAERRAVARAG